jgi:thioredoxin 1
MAFTKEYAREALRRTDVDALRGPVLLEFGTDWCGFCLAAQPLLAGALTKHPSVRHIKVEDGPRRPLGRSFGVKLWPTLIFMRDGQELSRLVRPEDQERVERALAAITAPTPM